MSSEKKNQFSLLQMQRIRRVAEILAMSQISNLNSTQYEALLYEALSKRLQQESSAQAKTKAPE